MTSDVLTSFRSLVSLIMMASGLAYSIRFSTHAILPRMPFMITTTVFQFFPLWGRSWVELDEEPMSDTDVVDPTGWCSHCHVVDVMNYIILCSYAGFVLNVCLLDRCGKCTYMAINTFWIWIWILIDRTFSTYRRNFSSNHPRNTPHRSPSWASCGCRSWVQSLIQVLRL